MFDASVFSLGPIRGRELLVAESLVIRYVIVHSRLVRTTQGARLFNIDQSCGQPRQSRSRTLSRELCTLSVPL